MRLLALIDRLNPVAGLLVDAAIRGAIVLLAALALTYALRKRTAAMRHLIWVGAVLVQLLLPVFALWGPKWDVAVPAMVESTLPAEVQVLRSAQDDNPAVATAQTAEAPASATRDANTTSQVEPTRRPVTARQLLIALWALGALLIVGRLAIGTTVVARLARKGNRIDDGNWLSLAQRLSASLQIDRPLTLLRGSKLGVPVTWGIVYPVVLLPEDADHWSEERRRFVLVHEMAHVKRLDALTQLAGQFALALFWFDPLVWIANRRMQMEREHACDDYVIRHGTTPSTYAEELLTMVRSLGEPNHHSSQPAFAALAMARRSEFEGRMLSILDPRLDRHPLSKGRTLVSALLALALVVPLAALQPYRHAADTPVVHAVALDLPDSFKVSITASDDTSRKALVPPARAVVPIAPPAPVPGQPVSEKPASETVTTSGAKATCATVKPSTKGTSTHTHAETTDDGTVNIDYLSYNTATCMSATILGKVRYSVAEDDIIDVPRGALAAFHERAAGGERELIFSPNDNGAPPRSYRRDGHTVDFGDEGRRWFAALLPRILMETGMNVGPRVARWKSEGGVDKVVAEIEKMGSTSAKRYHYVGLIEAGKLNASETDKVVRSASTALEQSPSDLRAVLSQAAPHGRVSRETIPALERALTSMKSSGDQSAIAQIYGQTDDKDMLLAVMRVTGTISSSGDRSRVLQVLASRYLSKSDRELENAFFSVADEMPSSGDQRNVLLVSIAYASNPSVAAHIIKSARGVSSSGDRAAIFLSMATPTVLVNKALKDAFFNAVAELPSDADRVRVLQSAAGIRP